MVMAHAPTFRPALHQQEEPMRLCAWAHANADAIWMPSSAIEWVRTRYLESFFTAVTAVITFFTKSADKENGAAIACLRLHDHRAGAKEGSGVSNA